jgi:bifunctional N-acetylglucosamine-1-phosphate-uridyltransferase/glucosamine-1-phosphate-acetyltransferase GlmU-like protein
LPKVTRNALTNEYYLTDVPALLMAEGRPVEVLDAVPPEDVLSINTPEDLAMVDAVYRKRVTK